MKMILKMAMFLMPLMLCAELEAKSKKSAKKSKVIRMVNSNSQKTDTLESLTKSFLSGKLKKADLWKKLAALEAQSSKLKHKEKIKLLQVQSQVLMKAGYPILASAYATNSIKRAKLPLSAPLNHSWKLLYQNVRKYKIQNMLEELAGVVNTGGKDPKYFESNWNYFIGQAQLNKGRVTRAAKYFAQVKANDYYYLPAKHNLALISYRKNELTQAEQQFMAVTYDSSAALSEMPREKVTELQNVAYLNLGRIFYETKKFDESIRAYRRVSKGSPQYYDSLFEQGWALFMGGYPNHALGAIHSAQSPFFANQYNPEAEMLKALSYYWVCHYSDARRVVDAFQKKYSESMQGLTDFLAKRHLNNETSFLLFENLLSGVSSSSLGIDREVLGTAARKESLRLPREQLASVLDEKRRLKKYGVYRTLGGTAKGLAFLEKWEKDLRIEIGKQFLAELNDYKAEFEEMHDQAEFLYIELLMSEKEQILGKELHASNKINPVSSDEEIGGWGSVDKLSWKGSHATEYWWDEVGHYIYQLEPQCKN